MMFLENVFEKVRRHPKRIVFPEGEDLRVIQAAVAFFEERLGTPVLLGHEKTIRELARRHRISLDHVLVLEPA
ncbi:MAG: phosphate acetyltransferase, partial [Verrucomicrobiae bacterium]|nr:phosphate acetyltransferase [Verrucomicrobiae bacterium]